MNVSSQHRNRIIILVSICLVAIATQSFGFNNNIASTEMGYDFWNMASTMSSGAVGKTIGLGGLALSCFFLFKQQVLPAIGTAMGSMGLAKSSSILTTFGGTF